MKGNRKYNVNPDMIDQFIQDGEEDLQILSARAIA